jgi:hypothetical protein
VPHSVFKRLMSVTSTNEHYFCTLLIGSDVLNIDIFENLVKL